MYAVGALTVETGDASQLQQSRLVGKIGIKQ